MEINKQKTTNKLRGQSPRANYTDCDMEIHGTNMSSNILYFSILLHSFNTEYLFFCVTLMDKRTNIQCLLMSYHKNNKDSVSHIQVLAPCESTHFRTSRNGGSKLRAISS
jgi:hypothetical protein